MSKQMERPNIGLNRTITLPPSWRTAPVQLMETVGSGRTDDGHEMVLALGMLADGTNLTVLSYPGGARLHRAGPSTDWATEEATRGREPWERHRAMVEAMWSQVDVVSRQAHEDALADKELSEAEQAWIHRDATLLALTASMRNAADAFANGAAFDAEQLRAEQDRMSRALRDAVLVGATNAQISMAIAAAKEGRGEMQAAVLDTLISYVENEAPEAGEPS